MPYILTDDGIGGWNGPAGTTITLISRVHGDSKLQPVTYAGKLYDLVAIDDKTCKVTFPIAAGSHRVIFTYAGDAADTIDITEPEDLPAGAIQAAAAEQEIGGCEDEIAPTAAPRITGVAAGAAAAGAAAGASGVAGGGD